LYFTTPLKEQLSLSIKWKKTKNNNKKKTYLKAPEGIHRQAGTSED
jgi:hypothetical protein